MDIRSAFVEQTIICKHTFKVHERQTARMRTRSQWFLAPSVECTSCGGSLDIALNDANVSALTNALLRRSSSGTIGRCKRSLQTKHLNHIF